jgi:hypothetical protein
VRPGPGKPPSWVTGKKKKTKGFFNQLSTAAVGSNTACGLPGAKLLFAHTCQFPNIFSSYLGSPLSTFPLSAMLVLFLVP